MHKQFGKINNYLIEIAYGIKVIFDGRLISVSFSLVETTFNRCAHLTKSNIEVKLTTFYKFYSIFL
jgi:hypothetical protein